jgi:ABC-type polysaccharide/polyol phosphate export permease
MERWQSGRMRSRHRLRSGGVPPLSRREKPFRKSQVTRCSRGMVSELLKCGYAYRSVNGLFAIIKEIWTRRDLIHELAVKDLKLRYSRPLLGFLWAFIFPFLNAAVLYLFFLVILKVKLMEAPFLLYLMSATFSWRFFQDSLSCATTSLMDNKNLLREARFPHYFIPLSIVLANAVNFLPSLAILIMTSLIYLKGLSPLIVLLPVIFAVHLLITIGFSIVLSILYLKWRDTKFILEIFLLLLFYLTPTVYSVSLMKAALPGWLFHAFIHEPFTGILNFYRVTLLKGFYGFIAGEAGFFSIFISPMLFAILAGWFGFYYYQRNKSDINDHLSY